MDLAGESAKTPSLPHHWSACGNHGMAAGKPEHLYVEVQEWKGLEGKGVHGKAQREKLAVTEGAQSRPVIKSSQAALKPPLCDVINTL